MTDWPEFVTRALALLQERPHVALAIIGVLIILWLVADPEPERCSARRYRRRCVHGDKHPGSHRDEFGDHWN